MVVKLMKPCEKKKWRAGPQTNDATGEALWKTCVPAGTPCVFPFVFEGETYNSCAIEGDNAWCATKVNTDHSVVNGHWAYCDCDVSSDFVNIAITSTTATSTTVTTTKTTTTVTMPQWPVTRTLAWVICPMVCMVFNILT